MSGAEAVLLVAPDRLRLALAALVTAGAVTAIVIWARAGRTSPQQRERARRQRLATMGRLTDGTVVDVCELPREPETAGGGYAPPTLLLIFKYDVAGVTYEASQDVTRLRQFLDLHSCRLGIPTSVKYDTQNPGNSIVIAEGWNGLRKTPNRIRAAVEAAAPPAF